MVSRLWYFHPMARHLHPELQVARFFSGMCRGMSRLWSNGTVGFADFLQFVEQFGFSRSDEGYEARFDLDGDGVIGFGDFLIFANHFGKEVS